MTCGPAILKLTVKWNKNYIIMFGQFFIIEYHIFGRSRLFPDKKIMVSLPRYFTIMGFTAPGLQPRDYNHGIAVTILQPRDYNQWSGKIMIKRI